MNNSKSTPIIIIGIAVFIIGGAALFLVLRDNKSTKKSSTPPVVAGVTTTTTPGSVSFSTATASTLPAFVIPAGLNALSLQMDYFGGVGGYVKPGSVINVFAILNKDCATANFPLTVGLIKSNVKVLEVLGQGPQQTGQPHSYLLAATPQDAAQLIFYSKLGQLYFTLTTGTEPAATPSPVTCGKAP